MKITHRTVLSFAIAALAAAPSYAAFTFPCGLPISNISVSYLPSSPAPGELDRRERVEISDDLATSLGITAADLHGAGQPNPQIRLRTQSSPANSGIDNNNSVFTVMAIRPATGHRVWVHRRSSSTDRDSGQYKLFATTGTNVYATADANADGIVDNILLRAFPFAVSATTFTDAAGVTKTSTYYCEPEAGKSYVEKAVRRADDRVLAMAPHGGNIEAPTSSQVAWFATALESINSTPVNVWNLEGKWGDNQTFPRWHVTSPTYDVASYPGLVDLLPADGTFDRAVSFHGFSGTSGPQVCSGQPARPLYQVILGGAAARNLKCAVARGINDAAITAGRSGEIGILIRDAGGNVSVEDNCGRAAAEPAGTDLAGLSAANIVNRLTSFGGIQLEQSKVLRDDNTLAKVVADGAAEGFADFAANSGFNYCTGL